VGLVVHTCNPRYLRSGDGRVVIQDQPGQKMFREIHVFKEQVECGVSRL
jgi:hypothetical protein